MQDAKEDHFRTFAENIPCADPGKPSAAAIVMKIPQVDCLLPFDPSSPNADWCGCCISVVLGGAQSRCIKRGVKQPKLGPRTLRRTSSWKIWKGVAEGLGLPSSVERCCRQTASNCDILRLGSLLSGFVFVKIPLSKTSDILVLQVSQRVL